MKAAVQGDAYGNGDEWDGWCNSEYAGLSKLESHTCDNKLYSAVHCTLYTVLALPVS